MIVLPVQILLWVLHLVQFSYVTVVAVDLVLVVMVVQEPEDQAEETLLEIHLHIVPLKVMQGERNNGRCQLIQQKLELVAELEVRDNPDLVEELVDLDQTLHL